jgi:hypothetical protein
MPITPRHTRVATLAAALALGAAMLASGAARAQAKTPAPAALSPVEKLVAEDDIRQKLALYGLLADGDGVTGPDIRALADQVMTPDVWTDLYFPDGSLQVHTVGRDQAISTSTPDLKKLGPIAQRHYMVSTYFDEVTPPRPRPAPPPCGCSSPATCWAPTAPRAGRTPAAAASSAP